MFVRFHLCVCVLGGGGGALFSFAWVGVRGEGSHKINIQTCVLYNYMYYTVKLGPCLCMC